MSSMAVGEGSGGGDPDELTGLDENLAEILENHEFRR